ncbi:guard cell S-type anion channel SLAC1 [Impatiens glandulifera]|uniref:guard cell S-type anion channel SLAC1 n=1 Tax=Impatiens glandulifera TaxID=253017 RepID=UPI001FB19A42|nr:guard cell S-type anion channel SLAC1 [Impatiens glandulifera]
MDTRATTCSSIVKKNTHLMDIREVSNEEDHHHEEEEEENIIQIEIPTKTDRQSNRPPIKPREAKRQQQQQQQQRSFNRQVSLETGFSALNRESNTKEDRKKVLSRSGNSFGGFGSANRIDGIRKPADFSIFRTKSSLGKQNSLLPSSWKDNEGDGNGNGGLRGPEASDHNNNNNTVPAGRYFAALRGPELDQIKDYEDILLPKDEIWPFLLRFPIGCFGICLGLSSQTILWQAMATSPSMAFLHITPFINLALWLLSLLVLVSVSITYMLKCVYYFEAVRREYFHPVRVNFFFAPWIVCMFLVIGAPKMLFPGPPHPAVWCVFMGPVFCLELKIYGQWLSGGKRRLSKVANPSSHLSVVGNFVGAILAAKVGWEEPAKFLWAVGFAHYLVVFVTLYQRLPTSEALPKELHPVYCMFIAAPSAASIAWETIYGEFDGCSRTCYFIALFLYVSLVVRINFFWGFRFSVAWWSYTFPMTTASLATIKYAEQVDSVISKGLALTLSFMSSTMVSSLLVSTLLHAFVWRTLFPNDLAIAITKKRVVVGKENKEKEKKPATKKTYDIRRWAKQSPLNFVSSITKHNQGNDKDSSHG